MIIIFVTDQFVFSHFLFLLVKFSQISQFSILLLWYYQFLVFFLDFLGLSLPHFSIRELSIFLMSIGVQARYKLFHFRCLPDALQFYLCIGILNTLDYKQ